MTQGDFLCHNSTFQEHVHLTGIDSGNKKHRKRPRHILISPDTKFCSQLAQSTVGIDSPHSLNVGEGC